MKQLTPCESVPGNILEYEIVAQRKIIKTFEFIKEHMPESFEKDEALKKLQESSSWLALTVTIDLPMNNPEVEV